MSEMKFILFSIILFSVFVLNVFSQENHWKKWIAKSESLYSNGKYKEALIEADKAFESVLKNFGEMHLNTAYTHNRLGEIYFSQFLFEKSKTHFLQALQIRRTGKEVPVKDIIESLNNIGVLYKHFKNYDKAYQFFSESLSLLKNLEEMHPYAAGTYNNIAFLYRVQGRFEESEELYKKVVALDLKRGGNSNPDLALDYNNLAELYCAVGRYDEAESLFQKSMTIYEKNLGPKHPDLAVCLNNLAVMYVYDEQCLAAEPLLKRAIKINQETYGEYYPGSVSDYAILGSIYYVLKQYLNSEFNYKKALFIIEDKKLNNKNQKESIIRNLISLYSKTGKLKEKEDLEQQLKS